jgi:oxygen-independent coproporphyrinogen-3 oxidase
MLGLYVHIPFCSAICNYCNFNRGLFDGALKERYVEAVVRELEQAGKAGRAGRAGKAGREAADVSAVARSAKADTIYFGGGTPSLLEPHEIRRIIAACQSAFDIAEDREVTLEANPESVNLTRLARYREAGVNRVSFGVQSFRDEELRRLSRLHDAARAAAAVREARAAGFDNVSLDLMMWLPSRASPSGSTPSTGHRLAPDHMSLYLLGYARTRRSRKRWRALVAGARRSGGSPYADRDGSARQAGYEQCSINVARPGRGPGTT